MAQVQTQVQTQLKETITPKVNQDNALQNNVPLNNAQLNNVQVNINNAAPNNNNVQQNNNIPDANNDKIPANQNKAPTNLNKAPANQNKALANQNKAPTNNNKGLNLFDLDAITKMKKLREDALQALQNGKEAIEMIKKARTKYKESCASYSPYCSGLHTMIEAIQSMEDRANVNIERFDLEKDSTDRINHSNLIKLNDRLNKLFISDSYFFKMGITKQTSDSLIDRIEKLIKEINSAFRHIKTECIPQFVKALKGIPTEHQRIQACLKKEDKKRQEETKTNIENMNKHNNDQMKKCELKQEVDDLKVLEKQTPKMESPGQLDMPPLDQCVMRPLGQCAMQSLGQSIMESLSQSVMEPPSQSVMEPPGQSVIEPPIQIAMEPKNPNPKAKPPNAPMGDFNAGLDMKLLIENTGLKQEIATLYKLLASKDKQLQKSKQALKQSKESHAKRNSRIAELEQELRILKQMQDQEDTQPDAQPEAQEVILTTPAFKSFRRNHSLVHTTGNCRNSQTFTA